MRRPLRTFVLITVGILPLLVVAAADLVFVPSLEARVEDRARRAATSASVEADIGTFPVVGRALARGEVASVDVPWLGVEVGAIQATSLHLHLDGLGFDRSELLGGRLQIEGVESGDVRLLVPPSQLSRLFGSEVRIHAGALRVRPTPDADVEVRASATAQSLVLTAPGAGSVTVELGGAQFPCAPTTSVEGQNLALACSFRGLPPILRAR